MTKARDLANAGTALTAVSATELGYLDGVTSAIQTQIDAKAPSSTAVTLTGTQTLTNKTLTNPVIASVVNNTLTTAKGDLVTATAASTPARLAVGNDGEQIVADSSTSTGLRYQSNFAAGKNKIINGDFRVWQRGTSFTQGSGYTADRFTMDMGGSSVTPTISQQTFTAGTAPVSGYEGTYFYRYAQASAGTSQAYNILCEQRVEDVRAFAGQTVTFSVWVKADATRNIQLVMAQAFGSGGSSYNLFLADSKTVGTSWTRYSSTVTVPSVAGKTIGAGSYVQVAVYGTDLNTAKTIDIWGMQVEAGSVATAFQTATGTIQGELAACQRYYFRSNPSSSFGWLGSGVAQSTTVTSMAVTLPATMRVVPTSVDFSTLALVDGVTSTAVTTCTIDSNVTSNNFGVVTASVASGLTQYRPYYLRQNSSAAGYIGFSAEL